MASRCSTCQAEFNDCNCPPPAYSSASPQLVPDGSPRSKAQSAPFPFPDYSPDDTTPTPSSETRTAPFAAYTPDIARRQQPTQYPQPSYHPRPLQQHCQPQSQPQEYHQQQFTTPQYPPSLYQRQPRPMVGDDHYASDTGGRRSSRRLRRCGDEGLGGGGFVGRKRNGERRAHNGPLASLVKAGVGAYRDRGAGK